MKSSEIATICIAVYGAILSTIAIAKQFTADRVKIKITVNPNMQIYGDPRYAGMTLILVEVANVGRRPITIRSIGARCLFPAHHFVMGDLTPQLPHEISEGQYISGVLNQADTDLSMVDYWEAWDSHGNAHKLRVASFPNRWISVFKRKSSNRGEG